RPRPLLRLLRRLREYLQEAEVLLAVIRALLLDPLVVTALHELAAVERDGLLVGADGRVLLARAARRVALGGEAVELLGVNAVGELRVQLIIAVAVEEEVLLQGLVAVERLAYVRDGRVEVLLHRAGVRLAPEGVNDRVLRGAAVAARGDEAEDVARAPRHPGVGRERARGVAEDFDRAEQTDRQVCRRPLPDDDRR